MTKEEVRLRAKLEELEGIIADQNVEILELKKQIYDYQNVDLWPESDRE